ncbi:DUF2867 domain-containing protein [Desulfovibrio gilichinskyi]|uniref:Pyridoxamine 5'-phosphate oxidase n=1 Tax=Desulfovibrio gilichinskyi TaxID=1519643 RepID=A0A1X7C5G9_9BACT|nr:DUF2867 domain-containing protein [Desulfovibrio gilichinskyi]SME90332.1 Pyridoxamine 5'-phosphate oxidase [Desulfovibrio gilichinskyi]
MKSEISWPEVIALFNKVQYASVATVDADGYPRITPIGSILFSGEGRGYYFEKFPKSMRSNLDRDPRMTIMAVAPRFGFWFGALWHGKFQSQPAIRLVCEAGGRRKATFEEVEAWLSKVSMFRHLKGHSLLWKDMSMVREFKVIRVEPVELGKMNANRSPMDNLYAVAVLHELINGADYVDSKSFVSKCTMNEFLVRMLTYQPAWLGVLYKVRGVFAKIMGLQHDVTSNKNVKIENFDFEAGGKVDFFTSVDYKSEQYWIGTASDKHLSGYIGVVSEPLESGETRYHMFTIVNFCNWMGPLYFNLIRPFHHLIMHCMGKYAAKT